jgi:hypothetical protein
MDKKLSNIVFLEGLDRSGKTTIAEYLASTQGYTVIHDSTPDKKFFSSSYTGPSYYDLYREKIQSVLITNTKVVFDRGPLGETVWPFVYKRKPLLTPSQVKDIFELAASFLDEDQKPTKIILEDPEIESHWARCAASDEPLTREQFNLAYQRYRLAGKQFDFIFTNLPTLLRELGGTFLEQPKDSLEKFSKNSLENSPENLSKSTLITKVEDPYAYKLDRANAIRLVMSNRIIKRTGPHFDELDLEIKHFLSDRLAELLGERKVKQSLEDFTPEQIKVLKQLVNRLLENEK